MNCLNLKFSSEFKKYMCVFVDDKPVKLKSGNKPTKYMTEKETVKVRVVKWNAFCGKHWFWWQLLCYIISVFGIFYPNRQKEFWNVDCEYEVKLSENTDFEVGYRFLVGAGKSIFVRANAEYITKKELCVKDDEAKQRKKKFKWVKFGIIVFVAIIATIVIVLATN